MKDETAISFHLIPPLGSVRKIEKVSEIDEKRAEEHYHDYIIC